MKDKESSLDIYALVNIYREHIRDSFFKKIYDLGNRKFIFQINSPTLKKVPLYIDVRKGFCFMDVEREQEAGQFAMYLRKIFTDRKIRDIYQINFDRVVRIDTYGGDSIVLELFREGNLIVLKDNIIQYALEPREWKNRKIIKGEAYVPPSLTDPLSMNIENIMDIFSASKASIVQTMATRLNLGGELSEEILHRAGINKNTPALQSMGNIDSMIANLKDILQGSIRNRAYSFLVFHYFLNLCIDRILSDLFLHLSLEFLIESIYNINRLLPHVCERYWPDGPISVFIRPVPDAVLKNILKVGNNGIYITHGLGCRRILIDPGPVKNLL